MLQALDCLRQQEAASPASVEIRSPVRDSDTSRAFAKNGGVVQKWEELCWTPKRGRHLGNFCRLRSGWLAVDGSYLSYAGWKKDFAASRFQFAFYSLQYRHGCDPSTKRGAGFHLRLCATQRVF